MFISCIWFFQCYFCFTVKKQRGSVPALYYDINRMDCWWGSRFCLVFIMTSKNQIFKCAKIQLFVMSLKNFLWVGRGAECAMVSHKVKYKLLSSCVLHPYPTIWTLNCKSVLHFKSFHFSHSALCFLMKTYTVGGNRKYNSCLLNQIHLTNSQHTIRSIF